MKRRLSATIAASGVENELQSQFRPVPQKSVGRLQAVRDAVQVFVWTLAATALVHWLFGNWRQITGWPIAEYLAIVAVPLLWISWNGLDLADYGLRWAGIRQQLDATVRCAIPFSAFALLSFVSWGRFAKFANYVSMAAGIAALFLFGYVLRKHEASKAVAAPYLLLAFSINITPSIPVGVAFYLLLLGPAEEILFRGAIQSRLNLGFGRPFTFFGAQWGWGAVIAALLFGVMHILNLPALLEGHWVPNWWAGPVTFCLALPLAYLRERTGGVIAPALLHAYPQAIVFAVRGLFRS